MTTQNDQIAALTANMQQMQQMMMQMMQIQQPQAEDTDHPPKRQTPKVTIDAKTTNYQKVLETIQPHSLTFGIEDQPLDCLRFLAAGIGKAVSMFLAKNESATKNTVGILNTTGQNVVRQGSAHAGEGYEFQNTSRIDEINANRQKAVDRAEEARDASLVLIKSLVIKLEETLIDIDLVSAHENEKQQEYLAEQVDRVLVYLPLYAGPTDTYPSSQRRGVAISNFTTAMIAKTLAIAEVKYQQAKDICEDNKDRIEKEQQTLTRQQVRDSMSLTTGHRLNYAGYPDGEVPMSKSSVEAMYDAQGSFNELTEVEQQVEKERKSKKAS